jgi:hypothetical protein
MTEMARKRCSRSRKVGIKNGEGFFLVYSPERELGNLDDSAAESLQREGKMIFW